MSTGQASFSAWLFSVFSVVDALWKVLICDVNIFRHGAYSHSYMLIDLNAFVSNLSVFLNFQAPDPLIRPYVTAIDFTYISP